MRISFCVEDVDHWLPWLKDEKLFTKFTCQEIYGMDDSGGTLADLDRQDSLSIEAVLNQLSENAKIYIATDKSFWAVVGEGATKSTWVVLSTTHKTHTAPLNEVFWSPLQTIFDHLLSTTRITAFHDDFGVPNARTDKVFEISKNGKGVKCKIVSFPEATDQST